MGGTSVFCITIYFDLHEREWYSKNVFEAEIITAFNPHFLCLLTHSISSILTLPFFTLKQGGQQRVDYWVEGGWGALKVNEEGGVSLWRALDREAPGGAFGEAVVVAVDRGRPPLTASATLAITVTDVNDCAPTLLPPTVFHVIEDAPATLLGLLKATDEDVWALGHGPPFNLSLASSNPEHVLAAVTLKFDPSEYRSLLVLVLWREGDG